MPTNESIEQFVKQVLGCSCPDEVFEHIDYRETVGDANALKAITVGNRLLVYLVDLDRASSAEHLVAAVLHDGVAERNSRGLNRFRLVLITADPVEKRHTAQASFEASPLCDDKTHLHLVDTKAVAGLFE